jgi:D-aminoacyl-tRNA deacylase
VSHLALPAITLSTTDIAAQNMLLAFREMGFKETKRDGVLRREEIYLIVIDLPIVPTEEDSIPSGIDPYPIDYDAIARELGIGYYVVASRHTSRSGTPTLTVHATGNFGEAVYGGHPRELQRVVANPLRNVYLKLLDCPTDGFTVSLEATHHSPTQFITPMFFAEVGSNPEAWMNLDACRYMAEGILNGVQAQSKAPTAIGFGGGHYCPKYSEMEMNYAFGHIAPKYAFEHLDDNLIQQMVERTVEGVNHAFIEDSSKSSDRKRIEIALKKIGLDLEKA